MHGVVFVPITADAESWWAVGRKRTSTGQTFSARLLDSRRQAHNEDWMQTADRQVRTLPAHCVTRAGNANQISPRSIHLSPDDHFSWNLFVEVFRQRHRH